MMDMTEKWTMGHLWNYGIYKDVLFFNMSGVVFESHRFGYDVIIPMFELEDIELNKENRAMIRLMQHLF